MLLRTVFHVLTAAIQDDPANKNFMDEVKFPNFFNVSNDTDHHFRNGWTILNYNPLNI